MHPLIHFYSQHFLFLHSALSLSLNHKRGKEVYPASSYQTGAGESQGSHEALLSSIIYYTISNVHSWGINAGEVRHKTGHCICGDELHTVCYRKEMGAIILRTCSITCSLRDVISALDRSLSVSFSLAILSLSRRSASKSSCKEGKF